MTEDEQFALALKMSEQEARQLNSQEEEEEELLKKAIAASLSVSGTKIFGLNIFKVHFSMVETLLGLPWMSICAQKGYSSFETELAGSLPSSSYWL